jgi:transposase-like protein
MIAEKNKANSGNNEASLAAENPWIDVSKTRDTGSQRVLAVVQPNPEVPDKAVRRRFTAEYKLRILMLADACTEPGSLGALLRREGLYASNLNTWCHQRERGALSALTPKKRGRKESGRDPLVAENEKLRKENERITKRLRQAEIIIDVQKKISQILGIPLATPEEGGND